jgi:pantoate--beta-alanine ligase
MNQTLPIETGALAGPDIVRTRDALRARVRDWHLLGMRVGVVPTMGALHEGHLSLVEAAKRDCDRVIVTLFVNPTQFNNPDDLKTYPRTEESDAAKLAPLGVDLLYAPEVSEIYPDGFATKVSVAGLPEVMCGAHRPGHFDGVATVVTKLFTQTQADVAYFGEKDFQQLQIVRRLAKDLDLTVEIVGCETVREPDGLALSSRNLRLSKEARAIAPELNRAMREMVTAVRSGVSVNEARAAARARLETAGFESVEYLDLRDADLEALDAVQPGARLFAAAWLGGVRLIDNIAV